MVLNDEEDVSVFLSIEETFKGSMSVLSKITRFSTGTRAVWLLPFISFET